MLLTAARIGASQSAVRNPRLACSLSHVSSGHRQPGAGGLASRTRPPSLGILFIGIGGGVPAGNGTVFSALAAPSARPHVGGWALGSRLVGDRRALLLRWLGCIAVGRSA